MKFHYYLGHKSDAIQHIHKHIKSVSLSSMPIMLKWFKARAQSSPQGMLWDGKLENASLPHCQVTAEETVFLVGMEVRVHITKQAQANTEELNGAPSCSQPVCARNKCKVQHQFELARRHVF